MGSEWRGWFKAILIVFSLIVFFVWPLVPLCFAVINTFGYLTYYSHVHLLRWISMSAVALFFFLHRVLRNPNVSNNRKKWLVYFILLKTYFAMNALNGEGENSL